MSNICYRACAHLRISRPIHNAQGCGRGDVPERLVAEAAEAIPPRCAAVEAELDAGDDSSAAAIVCKSLDGVCLAEGAFFRQRNPLAVRGLADNGLQRLRAFKGASELRDGRTGGGGIPARCTPCLGGGRTRPQADACASR